MLPKPNANCSGSVKTEVLSLRDYSYPNQNSQHHLSTIIAHFSIHPGAGGFEIVPQNDWLPLVPTAGHATTVIIVPLVTPSMMSLSTMLIVTSLGIIHLISLPA